MKGQVYSDPNLIDFIEVCSKLPDDEREQYEAFAGEPYDALKVAAAYSMTPGPAGPWMYAVDGKALAIAGFRVIRPGVWQDWMFSTPAAWDDHWRTVTKVIRRAMDIALQTEAHRLQCLSLASRIHAHRWYRVLGLVQEGTLRGYGVNGEDAIMFARLRVPDNGR